MPEHDQPDPEDQGFTPPHSGSESTASPEDSSEPEQLEEAERYKEALKDERNALAVKGNSYFDALREEKAKPQEEQSLDAIRFYLAAWNMYSQCAKVAEHSMRAYEAGKNPTFNYDHDTADTMRLDVYE